MNYSGNSLKSLKSMQKFYKNNLSEGTNDKEIIQLNKQINDLEESKNESLKEKEQTEIDIINIENEIKRLDDKLNMFDQIQNLTKQRQELDIKITNDKQKREGYQKDILQSNYTYRIKTLVASLNEKYKKIEFNEEFQNRTISHMQASAIDEILEREYCICGEKLTDSHIQHLLEQRNYQPPISNAQLVQNFKTIIKDEIAGIKNDYIHLERVSDDYIDLIDNIVMGEEELVRLSEAIGNNDSKEIKEKNTKRNDLQYKREKLKERKVRLTLKADIDETERSKKEKRYQELLSEKNKNKINQIKYDLVEQSIWILEDRNEKDRQLRKTQIEEKANEHFSDIIYKSKTISLNDNFEYTVREKNGDIASPSEGERVSISMSLILAIIDSHKERIKEKNNSKEGFDYMNEKEFAIILDAAFANLDNLFSRRISEKLPNSVEQLILFSTNRQYQGAVEESLNEYVGKKYVLTIPTSDRENALTNDDLKEMQLMEVK
ncbi:hypothetical protein [Jeotgalibaca caeni]|uniref:hypothetical protein n=1 Tax=Jeotgalibaca caeni TaxID=3028623 RepID=UPI00237E29DB|nr:hypothetical protein [Jeotgalibaca caeni]MDE1550021.1 hypothetical protein [Jeotgalibaca caeni]